MHFVWSCIVLVWLLFGVSSSNEIIEYQLDEEGEADRFIGNVKLDSNLASIYETDVLNQFVFSFRQATGSYQLFTIGASNGVVRTRVSIDRETICAQQLVCAVELDVRATSGHHIEFIKVVVVIRDVNDNAPRFPEARITRTIPETTQVDSLVSLPAAQDADSGAFGVNMYALDDRAQTQFGLRVVEHTDGSIDVNLQVLAPLNREARDSYTFVITAYDGDITPKSGEMTVDVVISDVNDNTPTFTQEVYEATISENTPLATTILRVNATDPDSGDFGTVRYAFVDSTPVAVSQVFGLDDVTGDVFVRGPVDYEERSE